jgi:hypothetical protein
MEQDLGYRIAEMMKASAAEKEPQAGAPDAPRYSFMTTYPYGTFKSSDMYLWLDKLYKISRIGALRAGMPGAKRGLLPPIRAPAIPAALPKAAAAVSEAKGGFAEAIRRKKAEAPAAPQEEIEEAKPEEIEEARPKMEEEIEAPEMPAPEKAEEPEELEVEAAVAAPAKKRYEEEEIEAPEEIESKGDIGELNISEEEIKKTDEEEKPIEKKAARPPSGKIRVSYIDEHELPKVVEPEMLSWDIGKKAEEDIASIEEGSKSTVYQDKIDITKRLLELTKLKIREKDLSKKKKIDAEIVLLRDRMKGEKVKTADLPSIVKNHLSSEMEAAASELSESIDTTVAELKSKYESAKRIAEGDSELLGKIEMQFVSDSNYVSEEYAGVIDRAAKFFVGFHCKKVDAALERDIFTKKEAEPMKSSIREEYSAKFAEIREKIDALRQKKKELVASSDALSAIVKEIAAMKEAELLHELGARDRRAFLLYIKGEMDKSTAIAHARRSIAKEKGLPDELVDKYFPKGEEK